MLSERQRAGFLGELDTQIATALSVVRMSLADRAATPALFRMCVSAPFFPEPAHVREAAEGTPEGEAAADALVRLREAFLLAAQVMQYGERIPSPGSDLARYTYAARREALAAWQAAAIAVRKWRPSAHAGGAKAENRSALFAAGGFSLGRWAP